VDGASLARGATASDEGLVRRARQGDLAAFDALVASRIDRCYRLAWSILGNDADAADATQDAFASAWRELPRLREPAAFDGWLNRIVANAARSGRRHRARLREVQLVALDADGQPGERSVAAASRADLDDVTESDAIWRSFGRLRPDQRLLLVLHHVEDRPLAEIARSLGVPVGTVKRRLFDARRALERAMEAEA
jgi:RNA polymerase sigma-70 factor (ECF subfamily)